LDRINRTLRSYRGWDSQHVFNAHCSISDSNLKCNIQNDGCKTEFDDEFVNCITMSFGLVVSIYRRYKTTSCDKTTTRSKQNKSMVISRQRIRSKTFTRKNILIDISTKVIHEHMATGDIHYSVHIIAPTPLIFSDKIVTKRMAFYTNDIVQMIYNMRCIKHTYCESVINSDDV
jgi:hypothetical protein